MKVSSAYELEPDGGGTRLTQTLEAKAGSLGARMLIPIVQGRLEKKLDRGPRAAPGAVGRLMRALALAVLLLLALPGVAAAQVDEAANALKSDPVYVDPGAELADQVDAAALRARIGTRADLRRRAARQRGGGQPCPHADRAARGRR